MKRIRKMKMQAPKTTKLINLTDYKKTIPPGGLLNPGLRKGGGIGLKVGKS